MARRLQLHHSTFKETRMRAQDLMSHPAVTCHVNDPLTVAASLMWEHDCGALPVVRDGGELAGMITDRDICMAAFTQGRRLDEILVNTAMANHVISAHPDESLDEIEDQMAAHQVRRLPVVDGDGKPIGILSINDLAIESSQPDTRMMNGPSKVVRTLAAIGRSRAPKRRQRNGTEKYGRPPTPPEGETEGLYLR
jgi:CBS domain-containing protein